MAHMAKVGSSGWPAGLAWKVSGYRLAPVCISDVSGRMEKQGVFSSFCPGALANQMAAGGSSGRSLRIKDGSSLAFAQCIAGFE